MLGLAFNPQAAVMQLDDYLAMAVGEVKLSVQVEVLPARGRRAVAQSSCCRTDHYLLPSKR